jgi:hypothetical protein
MCNNTCRRLLQHRKKGIVIALTFNILKDNLRVVLED